MTDYASILRGFDEAPIDEVIAYLSEELPYFWREDYELTTQRPTNLVLVPDRAFIYVFDHYSILEAQGLAPQDSTIEDRLIGALGSSATVTKDREAGRLQGWIGPTKEVLGEGRDKGHVLAHSMGGLVDGHEINLYSQQSQLNRGHSEQGKKYRKMEAYCAEHPGTFVSNRLYYKDQSSKPHKIEYTILLPNKMVWTEMFTN